jgi:hypothetical protein
MTWELIIGSVIKGTKFLAYVPYTLCSYVLYILGFVTTLNHIEIIIILDEFINL